MKTPEVFRLLAGRGIFIRSVYAESLLEDFFVAAVTSVVGIRLYLHLTGFPQIAPGGLHIAHVLFGGVFMLAALVILLSFLNRSAKELGAVLGGIGFGAFIDELGKFITRDNDYFYEPAVALIYITFVLLYFAIRAIGRRQPLSPVECFANAMEITKQAAIISPGPEEHRLGLLMLDRCEGQVAGANDLKAILTSIETRPSPRPGPVARLKNMLTAFYEFAAGRWWFAGIVVGFFAFTSVAPLYTLVALVEWSWGLALGVPAGSAVLAILFRSRRKSTRRSSGLLVLIVIVSILLSWAILANLKHSPLTLIDWAQFIFPTIAASFVIAGVIVFPASRLRAYRLFRRSILVSIFFTQVLAFYESQLFALIGLLVNILVLLALRYIINHEESGLKESPPAP
ncbi:MAG: hypothetical protein HYX96_02210 [Chloroflexi bacterium]|nr:hypothetical protein [Chloroflexota bacterium]